MKRPRIKLLDRYLLGEFALSFFLSLFAFTVLFLLFDLFERLRTFIKEDSTFAQAGAYFLFKVPVIVHLMTPVAVMIGVLFSIGRLSQLSETTAMRASGASIVALLRPLLFAGGVISVLMFTLGETVVPLCAQRVEELYQQDIKKKVELGTYSRENYWYRDGNRFFNIAHYDSRLSLLKELTIFEFNGAFELTKRIDAEEAEWGGPQVGWIMKKPVEVTFEPGGKMRLTPFRQLPLVIEEQPEDFYNMKRDPETLNYQALGDYVAKLKSEGVPVTPYLVELAAKLSFPLVNVILVLVAFPFALGTARSGTLTRGFVAGISIGFGYYFVHALSTSLGGAELIPVYPAAWAANILFATVGGYFLAGAEYGS